MDLKDKSIQELAGIVSHDWKNVYFGAKPYLEAMCSLETVNDNYGLDSGKSVVLYFLANANGWKGEAARQVKAELKRRIK